MASYWRSRRAAWRPEPDPATPQLLDLESGLVALEQRLCGGQLHSTPGALRPGSGALVSAAPIAAAAGAALSGQRSAAFVQARELAGFVGQLKDAVRRHVPLVAYARFRTEAAWHADHSAYHAIADSGSFQIFPGTLQDAMDYALVARRLAELSLTPGLIGLDLNLLDLAAASSAGLEAAAVGRPGGAIEAPTPAQFLIFGEQRRRVPRWLDRDHPVSVGARAAPVQGAAVAHGQEIFFGADLTELASEVLSEFEALSGRRLSFLFEFATEKADCLVVAQGAAVQSAVAAAQFLRAGGGPRCGVIGLTWLRPFPKSRLQDLLDGPRPVAVLECADGPDPHPPLWRELRARLAIDSRQSWTSAVYGRHGDALSVADLAGLMREAASGQSPARVLLGLQSDVSSLKAFPKREALVQAAASDYPHLYTLGTEPEATLQLPPECKVVEWIGSDESVPTGWAVRLAQACSEIAGPRVQACFWEAGHGLSRTRVVSGPVDVPVHQGGVTLDCLVLGTGSLRLLDDPFKDVPDGGAVVVATHQTPALLRELLPSRWRDRIREQQLMLYVASPEPDELLDAVRAVLVGGEEVPCPTLSVGLAPDPPPTPHVRPVLRNQSARQTHDNLPRHWGEVMEPVEHGLRSGIPDPLTTLGIAPAASGALSGSRASCAGELPVLDSDLCSGCGVCWTACPDSAIAATAIGLDELLQAAIRSAGISGKAAGVLGRTVRKIARSAATGIRDGDAASLDPEILRQGWLQQRPKLSGSDEELAELDRLFDVVAATASSGRPAVTPHFFSERHGDRLLVLSISPSHCQGCGVCASECPEEALQMRTRSPEIVEPAQRAWEMSGELPDIPAELAEAAADWLEPGVLAGAMLSRHVAQASLGGATADPGSGARLVCRMTFGLAESLGHSVSHKVSAGAAQLAGALREKAEGSLTEGLKALGSGHLESALRELSGGRTSLAELDRQLAELDHGITVDRSTILQLVECAASLEALEERLVKGPSSLGKSRLAVVVSGQAGLRWAGHYPSHPLEAPLLVELSPAAVDMLLGAAHGFADDHVDQVRLLRKAAAMVESPADLPDRLADLEQLTWAGLTAEERRQAPALFLVTDEESLLSCPADALRRLVSSPYPIRVLVPGSARPRLSLTMGPILEACTLDAFVLSGSLARPRHLADGLKRGMEFDGAALFYVHAPEPVRDGFAPEATLRRARTALRARVHPVFVYDPAREGRFGERFSLDDDPAVPADRGDSAFLEWAFGEARFSHYFGEPGAGAPTVAWSDYLALSPSEQASQTPVFDLPTGERHSIDPDLLAEAALCRSAWEVLRDLAGSEAALPGPTPEPLPAGAQPCPPGQADRLESRLSGSGARLDLDPELTRRLRARLLELAGFDSQDTVE